MEENEVKRQCFILTHLMVLDIYSKNWGQWPPDLVGSVTSLPHMVSDPLTSWGQWPHDLVESVTLVGSVTTMTSWPCGVSNPMTSWSQWPSWGQWPQWPPDVVGSMTPWRRVVNDPLTLCFLDLCILYCTLQMYACLVNVQSYEHGLFWTVIPRDIRTGNDSIDECSR